MISISVVFSHLLFSSVQLLAVVGVPLVCSTSLFSFSIVASFISSFVVSSERIGSSVTLSPMSSETASTATASSTDASTASIETSSAALAAPMIQLRRTKNIAIYLIFIVIPPNYISTLLSYEKSKYSF